MTKLSYVFWYCCNVAVGVSIVLVHMHLGETDLARLYLAMQYCRQPYAASILFYLSRELLARCCN